jgi:3-hydroxybutyryl-CoA dehydratase
MSAAAILSFEDMREGLEYVFEHTITEADIDAFGSLSGDVNPLHMDRGFAASRGFEGRVAHGAFLTSLASRLVGMYLPGRDCLLFSLQMKFSLPVLVGETVRVTGRVDQISEASRSIFVKISFRNVTTRSEAASGKAGVSFTKFS